MIDQWHAVVLGMGAAERQVVVAAGQVDQILVTVYVLLLKTQLKPGSFAAFMDAMHLNAAASLRDEPGCLTFDVMCDRIDPGRVWLYEVYVDEAREPRIFSPAGRWWSH